MNFEGRAMTTASIRTALFATAAVVLIWRGAATESDDVRYGLQAAFETRASSSPWHCRCSVCA
jgi:hypothetical protein